MQMQIICVRVLDAPLIIDKEFTYSIPDAIGPTKRGSLLRIPFGRSNRLTWGVAMGDSSQADIENPDSIKPVISKLSEDLNLTEEMLGLCQFLSEQYLCTFGDAVRTILPPALLSSLGQNLRFSSFFSLQNESISLRSEMQKKIVTYLKENGKTEKEELEKTLGCTSAQLRALQEKGILLKSEVEYYRNPYAKYAQKRDTTPIYLSLSQMKAFDRLKELYDEHKPHAALLYGVTGSGKTKVMMKLMDEVISNGKTVILMVPEIALTPQTVGIFCSRYGERVAVIHSSLSAGERFDAWRRIKNGLVDLVIGTRSAVFSPLPNIGLIIVDEEHEHTYKSDKDPKYHTRHICSYRAKEHNALVLFASATPSFESYYKAKNGIYELIELTERFGGAKLPDVDVVDMRNELKSGNRSSFSRLLFEELEKRQERGEQSILFLNHRGYHATLQCKSCGNVFTCPHCSVNLTYHTTPSPHLLCHLCGFRQPVPKTCDNCGEKYLKFLGIGTEKVESEIQNQLPNMKTIRMDADTTTKKESYDRMLEEFRLQKADILLGTQMVTKGHDFPKVTLVGVMLADTGLFAPDFRASERSFSLLTQVIGRAGRSKDKGRAIIQTFNPNHEVIEWAKTQNYPAFYESEIQMRKQLLFPPFVDIVKLVFTSAREDTLIEEINRAKEEAISLSQKCYPQMPLEIHGPLEPAIYKENEKCRLQLIFKVRLSKQSREFFYKLMTSPKRNQQVACAIDINPI